MPFALRLSVICLVPKFSSVPHPMKKYPTLLLKAFASVNTPPAKVSRFTPKMAPLKVPIYEKVSRLAVVMSRVCFPPH